MIAVLLFFAMAVVLVVNGLSGLSRRGPAKNIVPGRKNPQMAQLLGYAQRLYSERKYLAAERAFMEVLKHEHRNANAYSHLARIYLSLKNYPDAIECAQILSQIEPSAHNFFGLGTIYFDNKNYVKAIAAFEKAIMFEPSAGRYDALARSYQKLANYNKAVAAAQKAIELDKGHRYQHLLADLYSASGDQVKAKEIYAKILKAKTKESSGTGAQKKASDSLEKAPA